MTPERWKQVDKLLQAALERDPADRAAFLKNACGGDEALRNDVESLLVSNEQTDDFLNAPAFEKAAHLIADEQTDSLLGRSLGPYQILSLLGAGGMGEVYLAQDTRLGRKVALKLLPPFFTRDEQRLKRFQQEARAASALNHPNIVTIFEIAKIDGVHLIATECIAGETLRKRLSKTKLELNAVLDVAIQVASALAAAHEAGIIHRDIKPDNIMLRPDGYVKVLDFGLAKMNRQLNVEPGTEAPTLAKVSTDPGTVMGTVTYMSPEQARGQTVDARSDIFSLGVVFYEMIAGRAPFEGETSSDVIAAILEKQPPQLARYDPNVPPEAQWIATRALRKDRNERYQTIREMLGDLKDLRSELDVQSRLDQRASGSADDRSRDEHGLRTLAGEHSSVTGESALSTSSAEIIISEIRQHKFGAVLISLGLLAVMVALGFALSKFIWRNGPSSSLISPKMTRLTTGGRVGIEVISGGTAISPDGRYVVFVTNEKGNWSLWLRQVSSNSLQRILGPLAGDCRTSTFSPDGESVFYTAVDPDNPDGGLYQVPVLGGSPRRVLSNIAGSISFSPDHKQFAFVRYEYPANESHLVIADVDGNGQHILATHDLHRHFSNHPSWSPDGKMIACGVMAADRSINIVTGTVVGISIDTGAEKPLTSRKWSNVFRVIWLNDGSGLVVGAAEQQLAEWALTQFWLLSYPSGEIRRITNDLTRYSTYSMSMTADSSALVTLQSDTYRQIWVAMPNEDASRAKQISHGKVDGFDGVSWTPDGRILYIAQPGQDRDIWVMNSDGSENRQLTSDTFSESIPQMTSDGRYVVFVSDRSGSHRLWRINRDGSDLKQLIDGDSAEWSFDCSPDGRWVVFQSDQSGTSSIWKVSVDGGAAVQLSGTQATLPVFSPDAKWIAYAVRDGRSSQKKVAIMPAEGGPPSKIFDAPLTTSEQALIRWSPDGTSLTYVVTLDGVDNIWAQPIEGGSPKQITNFQSDHILAFSWSREGRLALSRGNNTSDVVIIRDFK